jgi:hypothetical protein
MVHNPRFQWMAALVIGPLVGYLAAREALFSPASSVAAAVDQVQSKPLTIRREPAVLKI